MDPALRELVSTVLTGYKVIPVRLKIILDKIFSELKEEIVDNVLEECGWTFADYARGSVDQPTSSTIPDLSCEVLMERFSMVSPCVPLIESLRHGMLPSWPLLPYQLSSLLANNSTSVPPPPCSEASDAGSRQSTKSCDTDKDDDKESVSTEPAIESPTKTSNSKKRVTCEICKKSYCDKGALKIHTSAVHLKEMQMCTVPGCTKEFTSRRSRNRHSKNKNMKLHMADPGRESKSQERSDPFSVQLPTVTPSSPLDTGRKRRASPIEEIGFEPAIKESPLDLTNHTERKLSGNPAGMQLLILQRLMQNPTLNPLLFNALPPS